MSVLKKDAKSAPHWVNRNLPQDMVTLIEFHPYNSSYINITQVIHITQVIWIQR